MLRVIFEGNRATGVQLESGGEIFEVEGNEIILSSGSIGSPHILMLSGVGPADHLRQFGIPVVHDLPGVGQSMRGPSHNIRSLQDLGRLPSGRQRGQDAVMHAGGPPKVQNLHNDLQILMSSLTNTTLFEPVAAEPSDDDQPPGIGMYSWVNLEASAGELRLTSADPYGKPSLDFKYFTDEFDLIRTREVVRTCARLGSHEAFANIIEERLRPSDAELESDEALDAFIRRSCRQRPAHHQHLQDGASIGPDGGGGPVRQGSRH